MLVMFFDNVRRQKVRVAHGRPDFGMSEQLLKRENIAARTPELGSKSMPELVGADLDPDLFSIGYKLLSERRPVNSTKLVTVRD